MIEIVLILYIMLQLRLHRARRRWSVSPDAENLSDEVVTEPTPSSPPVSSDADDSARRWSVSLPARSRLPSADRTRRRRRQRVSHVPRLSGCSSILASADAVAPLHSHFPVRYQATDWQNVYSTMKHGISLHTFYANCAGSEPVVILIRDGGGCVFGCYSSTPWKSSKQYYGNGEGFVFTIKPNFAVHKWTRANSYFQLSNSESIAMGGGGKFALFLDSMLEHGSSGPCDTFKSPCLASSDQFDIVVLEAYKLVSPFRLKMDPDSST